MSNDERIAILETTIHHTDVSLLELKHDLKVMLEKIEARFDKMDARLEKLNDRLWTQFYWMMGGFAGILAVVAHAFHWF